MAKRTTKTTKRAIKAPADGENSVVVFIDAQEKHEKHPSTFDAPSREELDRLKKGNIVKVCANDKERFWAIIQSISQDTVTAVVNNDLVFADEFGFDDGDIILFEKRHIYSIYTGW